MAVLMLTPLPGLLAILFIATIPRNSPLAGVSGNPAFYVHSALSYTIMSIGLLLFIRGALGWPEAWYSHKQMIIISVIICICNELVFVVIGSVWEFPVPFRDILGIVPYFIFFAIFHILIVGKTVFIKSQTQLLQYLPLLVAQGSTLIIFQSYAIIFEHVSLATQVVLTVCFPLLKSVVKRVIWHFSTCLNDVATDVTVCFAEIFGSLFLNVCIQNVRSPVVGATIIVIDIVQAILETRMYLSHKFIVDGKTAIQTAVKVVEGALFPGILKKDIEASFLRKSSEFASLASKGASIRLDQAVDRPKVIAQTRTRSFNKIATGGASIVEVGSINPATGRDYQDDSQLGDNGGMTSRRTSLLQAINRRGTLTVDDIAIDHKEHAKVLTQTLQLLFAAEVLTFAEYMEVVTSVTYALYMLALYRLLYAKYNLSFIGLEDEEFNMSMVTVGMYIALEVASMAMLCVLMHRKYGFSALYQLAFVLEKYWMSVQGKFIGSLALIFILNTVHHGKHEYN